MVFFYMRHKPRRHTDTSDTQRMQMQRRSWKRLWLGPSWQLHISVIQRSRGFWRWETYGKVMESMDESDEFLFHGPRSRAALPGPSPLWERRRCLGAKIGVVTMSMTLSVILTPWSQHVAAQLVPLSACHDVYAKGSWQLFLCESWCWWWRPQRCLVILLQKIHWNILKHIETYWNILKHIETYWNTIWLFWCHFGLGGDENATRCLCWSWPWGKVLKWRRTLGCWRRLSANIMTCLWG